MVIKQQDDILALIARNLAGMAGPEETRQLNEWIESSEDNKQYFEQIKNIWDASDKITDPKNINTAEALNKVLERISIKPFRKNFWYYWQKVAAVLILPLAVGALLAIYLNLQKPVSSNDLVYNEVYTPVGTRSSLRLADSTLVWLNSGSSLRYPNKFFNKNRKVYLKGEAYFEVESDIARPFIVQTSTLQVKATGTKFNVQEYESNPVTEVTLVSGKIVVKESKGTMNLKLISELDPDQHLAYNKVSKEKSVITDDTYKYIAWKDGKLIFRNEPLERVLNKLSMIFNFDFELHGTVLQDYRYRATFQDESLEEILKLLKLSAPINFREVERKPLPDGSFPKKKVIIFPAK